MQRDETEPSFIPPNIETPECGMDRRGRLRERTRSITWGHAHKGCAQGFVQSQCSDTRSTDIAIAFTQGSGRRMGHSLMSLQRGIGADEIGQRMKTF